jgi:hypothetical protein
VTNHCLLKVAYFEAPRGGLLWAPADKKVDVPAKLVVAFKPGREMEERVRQLTDVPDRVAAMPLAASK